MKTGHLRRCLLAKACGVRGVRLGLRSSAPSIWPVLIALVYSRCFERFAGPSTGGAHSRFARARGASLLFEDAPFGCARGIAA
jgi:hypothetical protein